MRSFYFKLLLLLLLLLLIHSNLAVFQMPVSLPKHFLFNILQKLSNSAACIKHCCFLHENTQTREKIQPFRTVL